MPLLTRLPQALPPRAPPHVRCLQDACGSVLWDPVARRRASGGRADVRHCRVPCLYRGQSGPAVPGGGTAQRLSEHELRAEAAREVCRGGGWRVPCRNDMEGAHSRSAGGQRGRGGGACRDTRRDRAVCSMSQRLHPLSAGWRVLRGLLDVMLLDMWVLVPGPSQVWGGKAVAVLILYAAPSWRPGPLP